MLTGVRTFVSAICCGGVSSFPFRSQYKTNQRGRQDNKERMTRIPDYAHNLSLKMSQVMDGIGVSEKIMMKRRRLMLLNESLFTLTHQLLGKDRNVFFFGSQIEGTTTIGLNSDLDCLISMNNYNVIQDWSEWEYGKHNLLMIQDEYVSPGYCL